MEKNIRCKKCGSNLFHIHRVAECKYVLKCIRGCECNFETNTEDGLKEFKYYSERR